MVEKSKSILTGAAIIAALKNINRTDVYVVDCVSNNSRDR